MHSFAILLKYNNLLCFITDLFITNLYILMHLSIAAVKFENLYY